MAMATITTVTMFIAMTSVLGYNFDHDHEQDDESAQNADVGHSRGNANEYGNDNCHDDGKTCMDDADYAHA